MKELMNITNDSTRNPAEVLREIFLSRKERNPHYSTRAFARDIGISQTLLSLLMSGKRSLTLAQAMKITAALEASKASAEDADDLLTMALSALPAGAKLIQKMKLQDKAPEVYFIDLELARFKVISQWYHLPILDLSTTKDFVSDPQWVAKRLGISSIEAKDAMDRLVTLGLADNKQDKFKKTYNKINFPTTSTQAAIRSFHKQMIGKAQEQLTLTSDEDFKAREISATTLAIPKSKIFEAKARIKAFQKEMAAFLTEGEVCEEVYQLNVQFFSLTKSINETKQGVST